MPDAFPYDPDWQLPGVADKRTIVSVAVSGATKSRTKSGTKRSFELKFEAREQAEFEAAKTFWNARYPGTTFYFVDKTVTPSINIECRFTSPFSWRPNGYNDYDYAFTCIEI